MNAMERCAACGIVPVVVIENAQDALPTARALLEGGIDVMEITMRTSAALESIRQVAAAAPEMLVGAGTVIDLDQAKACVEAGAKFIVSPGLNPEMVAWCMENHVPVLPGCVTPSEIMTAMRLGVDTMKFFPANVYGVANSKAMKARVRPLPRRTFHSDRRRECRKPGRKTYARALYPCRWRQLGMHQKGHLRA